MQPRSLYRIDPTPLSEHSLQVGERLSSGEFHTLSIREYGKAQGFPAVVFHGGPGDGCSLSKAEIFNPQYYRIILVDQRGSGQSTPKGCIEQNTSADLVADMNRVREFLKIKKWLITGNSWGTTLALLYAQAYPKTVAALLLRGVFLARAQDNNSFLSDHSPAARIYANGWKEFKETSRNLLAESKLGDSFEGRKDYYNEMYYRFLTDESSPEFKMRAAANYLRWLGNNLSLDPKIKSKNWLPSPDEITRLLVELSYHRKQHYIKENAILGNLEPIAKSRIPVYMVHGKFDLICHLGQVDDLQQALLAAKLEAGLITRTDVMAGHTSEAVTDKAMVETTDLIARKLHLIPKPPKPEKKIPLVVVSTALDTETKEVKVSFHFPQKKAALQHSKSALFQPATDTPASSDTHTNNPSAVVPRLVRGIQ